MWYAADFDPRLVTIIVEVIADVEAGQVYVVIQGVCNAVPDALMDAYVVEDPLKKVNTLAVGVPVTVYVPLNPASNPVTSPGDAWEETFAADFE